MKNWIALGTALVSLAVAALLLSVVPASECSTQQLPNFLGAAVAAAIYGLAGAYVAWSGERVQRLALFVVSALIAVVYIEVLRSALPIVVRTEISCGRVS